MRAHSALRFTILLSALAACGPKGPAAPSPAAAPTASLAAPRQPKIEQALGATRSVAAFRFSSRERYDDPALGVRVSFATAQGLRADVFAYPIREPAVDTTLEQRRGVATNELMAALAAIRIYQERGTYRNVTVAPPVRFDVPGPDGLVFPGAYASVSLELDGSPRQSELYVLDFLGSYIKVRATYPASFGAAARDDIRAFTASLVAMLAGSVDAGKPGDDA